MDRARDDRRSDLSGPGVAAVRLGRAHPVVLSAVSALLIIVVAFPSVIFLGGSVAGSNISRVVDPTRREPAGSLYPQPQDRPYGFGLADTGAAPLQQDPAIGFLARSIREGESPFWNPYSASGSVGPETLAEAELSPVALLAATLGGSGSAITLSVMLFSFLATWTVIEVIRRWVTPHWIGAVAAGVFFVTNGFAVGYLAVQVAVPYLIFPFLLLASAMLHERRGPGWFGASVAAHVALILTTFIPTALLVFAGSQVLVWVVAGGTRGAWRRALVRQLAPVAAAVGLCAFVLLPVLVHLTRSTDLSSYGGRSGPTGRPLAAWISAVTPLHAWEGRLNAPLGGVLRYTPYSGVTAVTLWASAGWRQRPSPAAIAAVALVIVGTATHLGIPPVDWVASLPGFRIIRGNYWPVLSAMGGTVLTGYAISTVQRGKARMVGASVALACILALFAMAFRSVAESTTAAGFNLVVVPLLGATTLALIGLSQLRRTTASRFIGAALFVLMTVELVGMMNHTRPRRFDVADPAPAYVQYVRENLGADRILNIGQRTLVPDWGSALGIRQAGTMTLGQLPWYRQLFRERVSEGPELFLVARDAVEALLDEVAIDAMAIRYLLVEPQGNQEAVNAMLSEYDIAFVDPVIGVTVLENPDVRPRAHIVAGLRAAEQSLDVGTATVAATSDGAFLRAAREAGIPASADRRPGTARIIEDSHSTVVIETDSQQPATLVLADTLHPGWHATVDGRAIPIARVNEAFRGVLVPRGRSTIVFRYRPAGFLAGTLVSTATVGLLLILSWRSRGRRRDGTSEEQSGLVRS